MAEKTEINKTNLKKNVKQKRKRGHIAVQENIRIAVQLKIDEFLKDEEQKTLEFPPLLTNVQRAFIHEYVRKKGLKSKSQGIDSSRFICVFKPNIAIIRDDAVFNLTDISKKSIFRLLKHQPLTQREKYDLAPMKKNPHSHHKYQFGVGTLTSAQLSIPPQYYNPQIESFKRQLPIYNMHDTILETINSNQVVVISGETGSGKTTQVPQYIMEDAANKKKVCRIICTQPRRLSAISVADRVAFERKEETGGTIGFQIRLESKTSPRSNLIYCTNGILIRCLMGANSKDIFRNITHVIIDEVHERDKHADFLLISLKEAIQSNPNLKVILMSATIDSNIFSKYFNGSPTLHIPGKVFEVLDYFLEDILMMTEYCKDDMELIKSKMPNSSDTSEPENVSSNAFLDAITNAHNLDDDTVTLINESLEMCWTQPSDEVFNQFLYLVDGENVPIDFRHTETDMTALMIAAGRGLANTVQILLKMGADPETTSKHGYKAIDWATKMNHYQCVELLNATKKDAMDNIQTNLDYIKVLLEIYQSKNNDNEVDHNLLYTVIKIIHNTMPPGSILIFLPGYDTIIQQHEKLRDGMAQNDLTANIQIFLLHSNMKISDQKDVFKSAPMGCRKIILSTNIAETSVTIDDVVYVIDCGKVKQNSFDALTGTTCLETTWISKSCAKQRAGRAGRTAPGVCFKLYSSARYDAMEEYTLPELLRVPLTEICLSAKLIAPQFPIADVLAKAIQSPPAISIRRSVQLLQTMGALDENENVTDLGNHLADLPVDAHLGKMIIYSILLKCVDPILTIVSALSVKDPFVLPTMGKDRWAAYDIKKTLSEGSFSDHLVLIKVFQKWLENTSMNSARLFCEKNFISSGNMQTICGVRSQILGYLRANGLVKSQGKGNIHDLNQHSKNWAIVKACLVAGLYPNICRLDKTKSVMNAAVSDNILPHPHSILGEKNQRSCKESVNKLPTEWMIFEEKIRGGFLQLVRCNTVVTPITVALFAGPLMMDENSLVPYKNPDHSDSECDENSKDHKEQINDDKTIYIVDEWIKFVLDTETAYFTFHLRQKLNALLVQLVHNPDQFHLHSNKNSYIVNTVADVLLAEDNFYQLPQPRGIGDRPHAVHLNFSSDINYGVPENLPLNVTENVNQRMANMSVQSNDCNKKMEFWGTQKSKILKSKNQDSSDKSNSNTTQKKYFIVRAASSNQVRNTFRNGAWSFSSSILKILMRIARFSPKTDLLLIFHIYSEKRYFGISKFIITPDTYYFEPISQVAVSFDKIHEFTKNNIDCKFSCLDGNELSQKTGKMFMDLMKFQNDEKIDDQQPCSSRQGF